MRQVDIIQYLIPVRFNPTMDFVEISEPIRENTNLSLSDVDQPLDQLLQNYKFWNQKFVSAELIDTKYFNGWFRYASSLTDFYISGTDSLPYNWFHDAIRFVKKVDISEFARQNDTREKTPFQNGYLVSFSEEAMSDARDLICLKDMSDIYNCFIEAIYFPTDIPEYIILINHHGGTERVKIRTRQNRYLFLGMYPNNNFRGFSSLDIQFEHPVEFFFILHHLNHSRECFRYPYFVMWNDHCWDSRGGVCVLKKVMNPF
jgi:hypothetical protein